MPRGELHTPRTPQDFEIPATPLDGHEHDKARKPKARPVDATACHVCKFIVAARTDACPNCGPR